jgi:hypothetical protein
MKNLTLKLNFIILFYFFGSTYPRVLPKIKSLSLSLSLSLWLSTCQGKLNKPWGRLIEGPGHYLTQIRKGRVVMKRCVDRLLYIIMPNDYRLFKYILKKYICRTRHHSNLKNNFDYKKNIWHLIFLGKKSCLRSRHLVLWSLETLTGQ